MEDTVIKVSEDQEDSRLKYKAVKRALKAESHLKEHQKKFLTEAEENLKEEALNEFLDRQKEALRSRKVKAFSFSFYIDFSMVLLIVS